MEKNISNGSLVQRKDGFWNAVVCLGNGKRKQIVRKNKEDAQSAMTAWLMENGYIEWELSGDLSVSVIMDEFTACAWRRRSAMPRFPMSCIFLKVRCTAWAWQTEKMI